MHLITNTIFKKLPRNFFTACKHTYNLRRKFEKKLIFDNQNVLYSKSILQHNKYFKSPNYIIYRNLSRFPRTPDLIYVPRVTRWLINKFRFKVLQKMWDPDFSEGAFIYGTTRAVCKITEIIHQNKPDDLEGLVTVSTKIKLTDDMHSRLTKGQKSMIRLYPADIKMLIPVSVNLKRQGDSKYCRIGMRVLALKWFREVNGVLNLVLVAIQTEFLRDYGKNALQEWTISGFEILECTMLTETVR